MEIIKMQKKKEIISKLGGMSLCKGAFTLPLQIGLFKPMLSNNP